MHAAGATAAMFFELAERLHGRLAVEAIDLPGRGSRYHNAPLRRVSDAVGFMMPLLRDFPHRGYALFGYSMGALVAFELTRKLQEAAGALPAFLVVAAARAPQVPARDDPIHLMDDQSLFGELVRFQGTTPELLNNQELIALLLPRLRADFELCETYVFREGDRLPFPVYAFGGHDDETVTVADLAAWSEVAREGTTCEQFRGGHFFINQQAGVLADRIAAFAEEAIHPQSSVSGTTGNG
nr:alpha/beta fold hydrolase [Rhizobium leguminosarum]